MMQFMVLQVIGLILIAGVISVNVQMYSQKYFLGNNTLEPKVAITSGQGCEVFSGNNFACIDSNNKIYVAYYNKKGESITPPKWVENKWFKRFECAW